jgi:hypothetical protein
VVIEKAVVPQCERHRRSSAGDRQDLRIGVVSRLPLNARRGASFSNLACSVDLGATRPIVMRDVGFGSVQFVSGNYFATLRDCRTGTLTADDDTPRAAAALVSDPFWRAFGRHPGVIGKTIDLNGKSLAIVGVTPPSFFGLTRLSYCVRETQEPQHGNSWWRIPNRAARTPERTRIAVIQLRSESPYPHQVSLSYSAGDDISSSSPAVSVKARLL